MATVHLWAVQNKLTVLGIHDNEDTLKQARFTLEVSLAYVSMVHGNGQV